MKAAADVITRNLGNELVLLDLARGVYFGLDEVGSRVWLLLSEGRSEHEIAKALAAEYAAAPEHIEEDVRRFLAQLANEGLVVE